MAGTTNCNTCGQANDAESEYCVRCGERLPDPSSTQLVGTPGAATPADPEYPWEPPAEWDPGELPPTAGQQQTWVGRGAEVRPDQVGWNTGQDTGAGTPWGGQPQQTAPGGSQYGQPAPKSKKPLLIALGAIVVVAAIVVGVVLAAGGSKKSNTGALNGLQNQSGADALTASRVALLNASSVHLTGTAPSNGQTIRVDVVLAGPNSQGTLTINNNDVQLVKLGQDVYIKGDQDFLKQYAGSNTAVLNQLNGKWLKTPTTSDFNEFSIAGLADQLKPTTSNKIDPKVTQSTLNGQPVVIVSASDGSKLTIANTGPPFPLVLNSKGGTGQLNLSDYNKSVSITAPPSDQVLDLSNGTPTPTPTPSPTASPSSNVADLIGAYDCTPANGGSGGGTLTLNADKSYTVSGGATGGFWGSSGDAVAFAGGALDKYAATFDGVDTLALRGSGTNSTVSLTCVHQ